MLIIALFELQAFMTKKVKRMKPGGGTPLYKPFRYVPSPPDRVGFFLRRFGLKTDILLAHFGLESDMVFEGTTECLNLLIASILNE